MRLYGICVFVCVTCTPFSDASENILMKCKQCVTTKCYKKCYKKLSLNSNQGQSLSIHTIIIINEGLPSSIRKLLQMCGFVHKNELLAWSFYLLWCSHIPHKFNPCEQWTMSDFHTIPPFWFPIFPECSIQRNSTLSIKIY